MHVCDACTLTWYQWDTLQYFLNLGCITCVTKRCFAANAWTCANEIIVSPLSQRHTAVWTGTLFPLQGWDVFRHKASILFRQLALATGKRCSHKQGRAVSYNVTMGGCCNGETPQESALLAKEHIQRTGMCRHAQLSLSELLNFIATKLMCVKCKYCHQPAHPTERERKSQ